jgi:predicted transcriptional regulator
VRLFTFLIFPRILKAELLIYEESLSYWDMHASRIEAVADFRLIQIISLLLRNNSMIDILESLFGSRAKTRLIRFFLLNSTEELSAVEIEERNKLRREDARKAIHLLEKITFLSSRSVKRKKFYSLNPAFPYKRELHNLIVAANKYPHCQSLKKIRQLGDVRLALVGGVFQNYAKGKADLILVANNVPKKKVTKLIGNIEAEIGKEIQYMYMNSDEFKYRMEMVDRFLIDFFEGPHEEIINKMPNLKRFIRTLKR